MAEYIKIESDKDLPTESCHVWVMGKSKKWYKGYFDIIDKTFLVTHPAFHHFDYKAEYYQIIVMPTEIPE